MVLRQRPVVVLSSCILGIAASIAAAGGGPAWTLEVLPESSQTNGEASVQNDLVGFLIGDYDEVANPGGTQTRPGLFGGSGNQPVDLEIGVGIGGTFSGPVAGGFRVTGDPASGTVGLENLQLDLLSESPAQLPVTVALVWETFRSFNPDSLFFGGLPIEVPLAEATLTLLEAAQAGPAVATTAPLGKDSWSLSVLLPVNLLASFDAVGSVIDLPPLPALLPLDGQITLAADGSATVTLGFAFEISEQGDGDPGTPVIEGLPFALPTILPPGGEANVLITAAPQTIALTLALDVSFTAGGPGDEPPLTGDVDGNGSVDFEDLLLVLADYGPCTPGTPCPADVDGDGAVAFNDVLLVLANWTA